VLPAMGVTIRHGAGGARANGPLRGKKQGYTRTQPVDVAQDACENTARVDVTGRCNRR
jgi:hypothetical protein